MEEEEINGKELSAANKAMVEEEKRKKEEEARQKWEIENRIWPDGLAHHSDGTKVFVPDGQIIGGVNVYAQKKAEGKVDPPSAPVEKSDHNIETIKEAEDKQKDIADASTAFARKDKTDAEAAAKQQKENEEAWSKLPINEHDGNQHWPDGTKHYYSPVLGDVPQHQVVKGVNDYAQVTHRKDSTDRQATFPDIETLEEKESRQNEIEEAQKTIEKEKQQALAAKKQETKLGTQMADGLIHAEDGRKFFMNGKEVSGVNNMA